MSSYDSAAIANVYDAMVEEEWARPDSDLAARIGLLIHHRFLHQYIKPSDRVLEVGAGPGRMSIELARIGSRITVTDVSEAMLSANAQRLEESHLEDQVEDRRFADVTDLSYFADAAFDATVAFGGPVSHALDKADVALKELLRVTKPGGYVLLSVLSFWGSSHEVLGDGFLEMLTTHGVESLGQIVDSLIVPAEVSAIGAFRFFTSSSLSEMLASLCGIVEISATNFLPVPSAELASTLEADDALWQLFLEWEFRACSAIPDGGHQIAVCAQTQVPGE